MTGQPDTPHPSRGVLIALAVLAAIAALAAVVAAVFLFVLPAREEPATPPEQAAPITAPEPTEATPSGIVEESEVVADALRAAGGEWSTHITSVELATALRRPVILVTTDIGAEQSGLSDELSAGLASFATGITTAEGASCTFYIQVLSAEGEIIGSVFDTDERWMLDATAAPADATALGVWLDETFGARAPAAEPWAGRVLTVTDPSTDPDGFVVVKTDLDPAVPADLRAAQMMIDAVNASGATFAPGVRVLFGDGAYEWSALLDGVDPYYQP